VNKRFVKASGQQLNITYYVYETFDCSKCLVSGFDFTCCVPALAFIAIRIITSDLMWCRCSM